MPQNSPEESGFGTGSQARQTALTGETPASQWFSDHREEYREIEQRLDRVRQKFRDADRETQRRMLLDSYIFAVLSVQTPLPVCEDAFERIKSGEDREIAVESVNYNRNKLRYIRETETEFESIDAVIDALLAGLASEASDTEARVVSRGRVDEAHRLLIDDFLGVGAVKAAFVLAILGFKGKACLDTNAAQVVGLEPDEIYSGVVVEKYEQQVDETIRALDIDAPTFIAQWVSFDLSRGEVARHDAFYGSLPVEV